MLTLIQHRVIANSTRPRLFVESWEKVTIKFSNGNPLYFLLHVLITDVETSMYVCECTSMFPTHVNFRRISMNFHVHIENLFMLRNENY